MKKHLFYDFSPQNVKKWLFTSRGKDLSEQNCSTVFTSPPVPPAYQIDKKSLFALKPPSCYFFDTPREALVVLFDKNTQKSAKTLKT